jgi:hypothetical protein
MAEGHGHTVGVPVLHAADAIYNQVECQVSQ